MATMNMSPIRDLNSARDHIGRFACPDGFSTFAWKQLQQTALEVWFAHLSGTHFRGSLNFCRPEFYGMLTQPDGSSIVGNCSIRRYKAA
jgi:hypothetical protein